MVSPELFQSKVVSPVKKFSFIKTESMPAFDLKLNLNKILSLD